MRKCKKILFSFDNEAPPGAVSHFYSDKISFEIKKEFSR